MACLRLVVYPLMFPSLKGSSGIMSNANIPAHIVAMYNRRYYVNRRILETLERRLYTSVRARPNFKEHFIVWKSDIDTYSVKWVDTEALWTIHILLMHGTDARGKHRIQEPIVSLYRADREGHLGRFSGNNLTHIGNALADTILGDAFNDVLTLKK